MAFLEKIPSWLRWILLLPLAFIAYLLASILISISIFSGLPEGGLLWQLTPWSLVQGPSAFVFVWVGAKVAPRAQFKISISLAVLYGLFYFIALIGVHLEGEKMAFRNELIVVLVGGLIGAVVACHIFYKKGKAQDTEHEVIEIHDQKE